MALTLTIVGALVLLGAALLGALRGPMRALLTLIGTLLGALLTAIWAPVWSNWLAAQLAINNRQTLLWAITCLTFLVCVLLVGYGAALLLPRATKPAEAARLTAARREPLPRALGGLLGLYEGVLVVGLLLRYTTDLLSNQSFNAAVEASPLARLLHQGLGWAFLAPALLVGGAVLGRATVVLVRRAAARRKPAPPLAGAPAQPPESSKVSS
jgi:uncharacterized membrane protein required for colicin V production